MATKVTVGATLAAVLLIGPTAAAEDSSAAPARPVVMAPLSIAADCSRDVSRPLQRWLQSRPDHAVVRLQRHGCYRVEREVVVRDKTGVVLDGQGAVLRRTTYTPPELRYPKANAVLRLVDFVHSTVMNLRIRGTNSKPDQPFLPADAGSYRPEVEFDHGLALHGLRHSVVKHVRVRSVWGDGVYLSGHDGRSTHLSHDSVLSHITVVQNGRQGININRSRHIVIDRADVHFSRRAAIDLEPDTARETISDIEIKNSYLASNLIAISAWGAGRVNNVDVHHNVIADSYVPWVLVESYKGLDRQGWTVRDNVVTFIVGSTNPAMIFSNTSDVVVARNQMAIQSSQSQLAVGLEKGSDAVVRCNMFLAAAPTFVDGPAGAARLRGNVVAPVARHCAGRRLPPDARVPMPLLRQGDRTGLVTYAERLLSVPNPGKVFDLETVGAVRHFQKEVGLPATGQLDAPTWAALRAG